MLRVLSALPQHRHPILHAACPQAASEVLQQDGQFLFLLEDFVLIFFSWVCTALPLTSFSRLLRHAGGYDGSILDSPIH